MPQSIATADAVRFLGHDLPHGATNVRAAGEDGLDRLVLLRFDAPAVEAGTFAKAMVGHAAPGSDPGLGYLGDGLDWWPSSPAPGFAGGESDTGGRTTKLVTVPGPNGQRTVFVAAFTR